MEKEISSTFASHDDSASQPLKRSNVAQADMISELPDDILSHILSFLPSKSSVMTSCLSRRWRFIWTSVSILDIDIRLSRPFLAQKKCKTQANEEESFKNFMNKVLILRFDVSVRKLKFLLVSTDNISVVHSWIWAAATRNVEELDIGSNVMVNLPTFLFMSPTLVVLKLYGKVSLIVPEYASLLNLKVVHLDHLVINLCDAYINRLISASPVLQELLIKMFPLQTINRISVVSSSLKTLIMGNQFRNNRFNVTIDAPKLEYLEFIGSGGGEGIDIEFSKTPSIVKATIEITGSDCRDVPEIRATASSLCSFCNLKVLSVSSFILKAALYCEHDIGFTSLTKLVVSYCGDDLSILPQILKRLPDLEFLVLNKLPCCNHTVEDWKQGKSEINCLKYTLKTLQLGSFEGNELEMPILEYFLENANVLNEVRASSILINEKELEKAILKKVLKYPRCSSAIKVIIF